MISLYIAVESDYGFRSECPATTDEATAVAALSARMPTVLYRPFLDSQYEITRYDIADDGSVEEWWTGYELEHYETLSNGRKMYRPVLREWIKL